MTSICHMIVGCCFAELSSFNIQCGIAVHNSTIIESFTVQSRWNSALIQCIYIYRIHSHIWQQCAYVCASFCIQCGKTCFFFVSFVLIYGDSVAVIYVGIQDRKRKRAQHALLSETALQNTINAHSSVLDGSSALVVVNVFFLHNWQVHNDLKYNCMYVLSEAIMRFDAENNVQKKLNDIYSMKKIALNSDTWRTIYTIIIIIKKTNKQNKNNEKWREHIGLCEVIKI